MYAKLKKIPQQPEMVEKAVEKLADVLLKLWFGYLPHWFNQIVRAIDRKTNAVNSATGHSRGAVTMGVLVLWIVVLGPTGSVIRNFDLEGPHLVYAVAGLAVAVAGAVFLFWAARYWPGRTLHSWQCLILIPLGLAVFFLLPDSHTEASGAPFPHIYALLVVILMTLSLIARWLSQWVLRGFLEADKRGSRAAADTKRAARLIADLVHDPRLNLMLNDLPKPKYSRPNAVKTLLAAPARKPMLLVFLPCFVAIFFREPGQARWAAAITLVLTWAALSWGMYYRHWDLFVAVLSRWFVLGGNKLVSLAVIVLGAGHVLDIQYISTVMQGGPVLRLVLAAYLVFWLYEYWINRFLYVNVLTVFKTGHPHGQDRRWELSLKQKDAPAADKLSILGGSRFLVHDEDRKKYRIYIPAVLFDRLPMHLGNEEGREAREAVRELRNRLRAYFSLLKVCLVIATLLFVGYQFFSKDPEPLMTLQQRAETTRAQHGTRGGQASTGVAGTHDEGAHEKAGEDVLKRRLREIATKGGNKAVLLAASGGGTRAALYTTSVLCGLSELGASPDIALISAVSGGAAAGAYYSAHLEELSATPCQSAELNRANGPWGRFYRTMQRSFINDVLSGVVEKRIIGDAQNGILLAESFRRHFGSARGIAEVDQFALIFNATLTGHPYSSSQILKGRQRPSGCIKDQYIVHAGSRLIITNLSNRGFPAVGPDYARDAYLNYEVLDRTYRVIGPAGHDSVPLFAAAALSANFPPVFSDAGISIQNPDDPACPARFWVTDGGATDNRGIISLLYALRESLGRIEDGSQLPDLHVVVAEASADAIDYGQIRGIGGKLSAAEHLASQLKTRLVSDVNAVACGLKPDHCDNGKSRLVHVHYLELPVMFRTRGGLGTHWKLPGSVRFSDPRVLAKSDAESRRRKASKDQLLSLMANLHGTTPCRERIGPGFQDWICEADGHQAIWQRLVEQLERRPPLTAPVR